MNKHPIRDQRLDDLESDFHTLLLACLRECRNGRWGLFGQNENSESAKFLYWEDAQRLKDISVEIRGVRAVFGQPNALVEHFLYFCLQRGANVPGETKLAAAFLDEIERGDFSIR